MIQVSHGRPPPREYAIDARQRPIEPRGPHPSLSDDALAAEDVFEGKPSPGPRPDGDDGTGACARRPGGDRRTPAARSGPDSASVDPVFPEVARLELNDLLGQIIDRAHEVMSGQDRLRALLRGTRAVAAGLDLPTVLHRIVESAAELVDARYAALAVLNPDGGVAEFVHVGMDPAAVMAGGGPPQGRGILGLLVTRPRPIRLTHLREHEASYGFPPGHPPMRTFLGVPIRVREEMYGNLYLTEKRDGTPFTAEDEELVVALADSAGVAVENARLYEQTSRRQRWQQATARIATSLLSGAPPEEGMRMVAEEAVLLLDADEGFVLDGTDVLTTASAPGLPVPAEVGGRAPEAPGPNIRVPFAGPGRDRGGLRLARSPGRAEFTEDDRLLAAGFAEQTAMAMELAQARADAERLRVFEERERIARDMHDHVIGRLFGAGLSVQGLSRWIDDPVGRQRLAEHVDELDAAIRDIRTAIYALRRDEHGSWGPRDRIRRVVSEASGHLGFDPELRICEQWDVPEGSLVVDNLLAVLREALTNVARHARASRVEVDVDQCVAPARTLRLRVHDDGAGPARQVLSPGPRSDGGHGLVNMECRATALGGSFSFTGGPGEGSTLVWEVPLPTGA